MAPTTATRALALLAAVGAAVVVTATTPTNENPALQCRQFQTIYKDGKDLCERIFDGAFEYIPRSNTTYYNLAYTMWWFDSVNPNYATTQRRIAAGLHPDPTYQSTDVCWLQTDGVTNHKETPTDESATFTECYPYRKNACCEEETVDNATVINKAYGAEYRWDRCGKLSPECERFFVQEACFYECDPNAGLFRKYTPAEVALNPALSSEEWEISKLPIQGDYCDAWFESCREQLFCGSGSFFECSRIPPPDPVTYALSGGAIAGIVIGSVVLFITFVFVVVLIRNERRGTPVFQKISAEDSRPLAKPGQVSGGNPTSGQSPVGRNDDTVVNI